MKKLKPFLPAIIMAILIFLLSTVFSVSFGQGFPATNPVSIPAGAIMPVQPLAANSAAVKFDSLWNQIKFQDEGVSLGTPQIKTVNLVGAGVTATRNGNIATITISGSSGQGNIQLKDEGTNQGTAGQATTYNVTGKGGSVSVSSSTATFTFPHQVALSTTLSGASNFYPYGVPQDSFLTYALRRGAWFLKDGAVQRAQTSDNGLNIHDQFAFVETDLDTLQFDCSGYNKAKMSFSVNVYVAQPSNYGSNYADEPFALLLTNSHATLNRTITFDSNFYKLNSRTTYFPPVPSFELFPGTQRTFNFKQETHGEATYWILMDDSGKALTLADIDAAGYLKNGGNDGAVTVGSNTTTTTIESSNTVHLTFSESGGGYTDFNGDDAVGLDSVDVGALDVDGRLHTNMGSSVTAANNLAVGYTGNKFHVAGTTTINLLDNTGWQDGDEVMLIFDGLSLTVTNGASSSGNFMPFALEGGTNFSVTQNDNLVVFLDQGRTVWREKSRSIQ